MSEKVVVENSEVDPNPIEEIKRQITEEELTDVKLRGYKKINVMRIAQDLASQGITLDMTYNTTKEDYFQNKTNEK
jgi:RNA-binding protein YhbY